MAFVAIVAHMLCILLLNISLENKGVVLMTHSCFMILARIYYVLCCPCLIHNEGTPSRVAVPGLKCLYAPLR